MWFMSIKLHTISSLSAYQCCSHHCRCVAYYHKVTRNEYKRWNMRTMTWHDNYEQNWKQLCLQFLFVTWFHFHSLSTQADRNKQRPCCLWTNHWTWNFPQEGQMVWWDWERGLVLPLSATLSSLHGHACSAPPFRHRPPLQVRKRLI